MSTYNEYLQLKPNSAKRILMYVLFMAIYSALALGTFTLLIDFSPSPEPLNYIELSPSTQRGIQKEAERLLISVDEFVEKYVYSTQGIEVEVNESILVLIVFVTVFPLFYFLFTNLVLNRLDTVNRSQIYDWQRKKHLQIFKDIVSDFYEQRGRYPSESDFQALFNHLKNPPHDPQEGKKVFDDRPVYYGYYYDRFNGLQSQNDEQFFRLWCYLQNGDRYVITPDTQTVHASSPVK